MYGWQNTPYYGNNDEINRKLKEATGISFTSLAAGFYYFRSCCATVYTLAGRLLFRGS